jgi:hypothetical protein
MLNDNRMHLPSGQSRSKTDRHRESDALASDGCDDGNARVDYVSHARCRSRQKP